MQSCTSTAYHLHNIAPQSDTEVTRVVITVDGPVRPQVGRLAQPDRLYLDLPNTSLSPGWTTRDITVADGRLQNIHISRPRYNFVRVMLGLNTFEQYRVSTQTRPYRVVAELVGKNGHLTPDTPPTSLVNIVPAASSTPVAAPGVPAASSVPAVASRGPEATSPAAAPTAATPPREMTAPRTPLVPKVAVSPPAAALRAPAQSAAPLTIVLDPGHGGKDPGAIGPAGLEEKTFVLQVAKELQQVMRHALPQARILLTRDHDVFLPLKERTRIANQHNADVFVSLHANSSPNRDASGIETWYLSFAASERARGQAARENMMAAGQLSELDIILRHLQQTDRINQSATLAQITQTALAQHMTTRYPAMPDRGVEGAPFVVLLHTTMPSILVELSFISNPQEEQRMRMPEYHRALAQGVWQGVQRFLQTAVTAAATKG